MHLVTRTLQEYGRIDILVNNVGGGGAGKEDPSKIELARFIRVFELNVFSMWRLCQLVAPHMNKGGYGSIINMSSMASVNTSPAISAYASSKAAINHMTRNLAFDYGPGIRVNAIGPGAVRTHALSTVLTPKIGRMLAHTSKALRRAGGYSWCRALFRGAHLSMGQRAGAFVNGGGEQTLD